MLYCNECEFIFPEGWADQYQPINGHLLCPSCGSDDLSRAEECESCGRELPEEQMEEGLCESCRADAMAKLRTVIFSRMFTPAQSTWIRGFYEEV